MRTHHRESSSGFGTRHIPVLLHEVIASLSITEGDTVFDGTVGGGGHAEAIGPLLGTTGHYYGVDLDERAVQETSAVLTRLNVPHTIVKSSFENVDQILATHSVEHVTKILLDLGWGTHTLESGRGFSFMKDEPLTMTYDSQPTEDTITASDIINSWSEETLTTLFRSYGGESRARFIAEKIVHRRDSKKFESSKDLAESIEGWIGKHSKVHPATKVFQALRITVNDELATLERTLEKCKKCVSVGGRIAVITFHSLEDTVVKHIFKEWVSAGDFTLVSKHIIPATREEVINNPRSRSAKLRVCIRTN